jgi:hypothetical protein
MVMGSAGFHGSYGHASPDVGIMAGGAAILRGDRACATSKN